MDKIRLQKLLADAGFGSRRECETMIENGEVTVNGKVAKLGDKAEPGVDHVKILGKLLKAQSDKVVVALYKPRGVMTYNPVDRSETTNTAYEYMRKVKERVQPVGRLETEQEGLILFTNDGALCEKLLKAKSMIPRVYDVKMDGHLEEKKLSRLSKGLLIEGKHTRAIQIRQGRLTAGKQWIRVTTTDPRHRLMKKLFEALGHPIDKVKRVQFANVTLAGLDRGLCRYLKPEEMRELYKAAGLEE